MVHKHLKNRSKIDSDDGDGKQKDPRLLIVDDHKIVSDSIGFTLETSADFKVVGRAVNGREAMSMAERLKPDIVLMDVSMPDMNGIEATRQMVGDNPHLKVVALTMHSAKPYVMGMLNAGASGYILKTSPFEEVVNGLRVVLSGTVYLSPEITHLVVEYAKNKEWEVVDSLSLLTNRERQVLQMISEGHTSKEIARRMNISAKTVDVHRNNIKKKLDIHTIAGLTKFAITKGLTDLADIQ
ncbi:MAG TPA: DNA-binding response regulator [Desulfobacteraceae bacterium]|nr:DNA-binding response regulator [Desulfobacteraceae bacterium]|tara:strand:- start:501 stop:1220 length:720 start_codon:yes stop_codon:yes gene_type:complete